MFKNKSDDWLKGYMAGIDKAIVLTRGVLGLFQDENKEIEIKQLKEKADGKDNVPVPETDKTLE